MAQGLKPSDNPVKVREFETRLLLVVFPVIYIYLFFFNYIFFFLYLGVGALYFLFLFLFFFGNTPPLMSVFSFLFSTWDAEEASGRGGGVRWCTA